MFLELLLFLFSWLFSLSLKCTEIAFVLVLPKLRLLFLLKLIYKLLTENQRVTMSDQDSKNNPYANYSFSDVCAFLCPVFSLFFFLNIF